MKVLYFLMIVGLLAGCKGKVYWLAGKLETKGVAARCMALTGLNHTLEMKDQLDRLVKQSLLEEDPDRLKKIAQEVSVHVKQLQSVLTPEYTEVYYPVTYRFPIQKSNLPKDARISYEEFSILGEPFLGTGMKIVDHEDFTEIVLERQATMLEMCALQGTVQGLFSVGKEGRDPKFFYRLYIEDAE